MGRRETRGGRPKSTGARLGGVWSLVGGVELSDSPDEPAVDGLPSAESFLLVDFFRAGAPSGHVHFEQARSQYIGSARSIGELAYISLAVCTTHAIRFRLITLRAIDAQC